MAINHRYPSKNRSVSRFRLPLPPSRVQHSGGQQFPYRRSAGRQRQYLSYPAPSKATRISGNSNICIIEGRLHRPSLAVSTMPTGNVCGCIPMAAPVRTMSMTLPSTTSAISTSPDPFPARLPERRNAARRSGRVCGQAQHIHKANANGSAHSEVLAKIGDVAGLPPDPIRSRTYLEQRSSGTAKQAILSSMRLLCSRRKDFCFRIY